MVSGLVAPGDRLPLVERRGTDVPLYNGVPVRVSPAGWIVLLLAVAVAFAVLTVGAPLAPSPLERGLRAIGFLGLPLIALAVVAPGSIGELFRSIGWRDVGVILFCLVLGLVVSGIVGTIVVQTTGAVSNPAAVALEAMAPAEIAMFFAATAIQLPGEELLALIPFMAIMALGHGRLGLSRRTALILAWIGSSLIFGAAHLPTYDWNWVQCLIVIASARIVLTLAFVITKNITVSSIVHILNDWLLFGSGLVFAGMATGAG
jgi:membrane protease YdiL (CAAX protease family)